MTDAEKIEKINELVKDVGLSKPMTIDDVYEEMKTSPIYEIAECLSDITQFCAELKSILEEKNEV